MPSSRRSGIGPIYPAPLKPPSSIRRWPDGPDDVRDLLRQWNGRHGGHKLSFWGRGVFKCPDCEQFCAPQPNGTAILDGADICDDCLIARARGVLGNG